MVNSRGLFILGNYLFSIRHRFMFVKGYFDYEKVFIVLPFGLPVPSFLQ
jgi:hypothetical protein